MMRPPPESPSLRLAQLRSLAPNHLATVTIMPRHPAHARSRRSPSRRPQPDPPYHDAALHHQVEAVTIGPPLTRAAVTVSCPMKATGASAAANSARYNNKTTAVNFIAYLLAFRLGSKLPCNLGACPPKQGSIALTRFRSIRDTGPDILNAAPGSPVPAHCTPAAPFHFVLLVIPRVTLLADPRHLRA